MKKIFFQSRSSTADIRTPERKSVEERDFSTFSPREGLRSKPSSDKHLSLKSFFTFVFVFCFLALITFFVVQVIRSYLEAQAAKEALYQAAEKIEFNSLNLAGLDVVQSKEDLEDLSQLLSGGVDWSAWWRGLQSSSWGENLTLWSRGPAILGDLKATITSYLGLANLGEKLFSSLPRLFSPGQGPVLLGTLEEITTTLKSLEETQQKLGVSIGAIPSLSGTAFNLPTLLDVKRLRTMTEALFTWLNQEESKHFIVVFQNTSEVRPSGGFFGSYAHLVLKKGELVSVSIHDVNEPDRLLDRLIVPPKPLQFLVKNWRAADANWFLDFPTSAEKTISFLEDSRLYSEKKIAFDGLLAITPQVLEDILQILGPIEVSGQIFSSDDFLMKIQSIIEKERAAGESLPKTVLQGLADGLSNKWQSLSPDKQKELLAFFSSWVENKDVQFFIKDQTLRSALLDFNIDGQLAALSGDDLYDYLALFGANIGGKKTDLFLSEEVSLKSRLEESGLVRNELVLARKHSGNHSNLSWYNAPNIQYMRMLLPPGTTLEVAEGVYERQAPARVFGKEYIRDEALVKYESTFESLPDFPGIERFKEQDKDGLAFWIRTNPGASSRHRFEYSWLLTRPLSDGVTYQLVLEKQAGERRSYHIEIAAPVGFRFKENGFPVYEYRSAELPARLVLTLTLEKDK